MAVAACLARFREARVLPACLNSVEACSEDDACGSVQDYDRRARGVAQAADQKRFHVLLRCGSFNYKDPHQLHRAFEAQQAHRFDVGYLGASHCIGV